MQETVSGAVAVRPNPTESTESTARKAILNNIDAYLAAHSISIDDLPTGSNVIDEFVKLFPLEAPVQSEHIDSDNIVTETSGYLVEHHGFPPEEINKLPKLLIMQIFQYVIAGSAASDPVQTPSLLTK